MYEKHDSFFALKHKKNQKIKNILERIIKTSKNDLILKKLSKAHQKILRTVIQDLLEGKKTETTLENSFNLKTNVISEIDTIDDKDLPRYLVHRYRYEIFPKIKKIDNFPPYLQIEPTSICNYRCVFCFETDETFTNKKNGHMGQMKLELFKNIIDQAEGNIEFISLASRGGAISLS